MHIFFQQNKKSISAGFTRHDAGFTLIELLVVLAIISIMTFVLLVQQSKFDSSTVLRSLAYNVALSVRQAQVYGVSVKESSLGTSVFAQAYGLYFNPAASPNSYLLFADANGDQRYTSSPDETVTTFKINNTYKVAEVCVIKSDGTRRCSGGDDSSGAGTINTLTVLFKRPNPDAQLLGLKSDGTFVLGDFADQYINAYVQIKATDSTLRGIHISQTGQVSVDQLCSSTSVPAATANNPHCI
ncbi:MAG: prepilin-type N-terminal cleavage/methylation domain-containing protein [bacterium]